MYFIPPATSYDNLYEMFYTKEAHLRLGIEGLSWGSVMEAYSTCVTDGGH